MQLAELWRYPVKSMAGERLRSTIVGVDGIPGDRTLYVTDSRGEIVSARTRPGLLAHRATLDEHGTRSSTAIPGTVSRQPLPCNKQQDLRPASSFASGAERFDILPLLVAADGAIDAFGYDSRRLRPNLVLSGVAGLNERTWQGRQIQIADTIIGLATLRGRCIVTT